jgi:exonuclease SbcC
MIRNILLENFMAHERTELELGPGVTALTGANNTGKSAVVEALRCVTTNPSVSHCIRHGAKEARVTLTMDDGARVTWIRKKRSAGYEITLPGRDEPEEPFWKLQGKVPDEVRALLRLDQVPLETGDPVDVHVGNQREPVFLLNRPDSNVAAFFAASTEGAHLLAMQNALKQRTTEAKRRDRELSERLARVEADLDGLATLPDIERRIDQARELETTATRLQADMPRLEGRIDTLGRVEAELAARQRTATILNGVVNVPKVNAVSGLDAVIRDMKGVNERLGTARSVGGSLVPLDGPPPMADTPGLADLCNGLQAVGRSLRKAEVVTASLGALAAPPAPDDTQKFSAMIDEMLTIHYRVQRLARWEAVLRTIGEPPRVEPDARLESLVAELRGLTLRRAAGEQGVAELETALRTVRETLTRRLAEAGACPTCGAELDAETFLERGHAHGR